MNQDLASLSEHDLAALLATASRELAARRDARKRETMDTIRELARSIGADVRFLETETAGPSGRRAPVPVKYRNPADPEQAWSGRGAHPKWLRALLEQGRSIEEFRV